MNYKDFHPERFRSDTRSGGEKPRHRLIGEYRETLRHSNTSIAGTGKAGRSGNAQTGDAERVRKGHHHPPTTLRLPHRKSDGRRKPRKRTMQKTLHHSGRNNPPRTHTILRRHNTTPNRTTRNNQHQKTPQKTVRKPHEQNKHQTSGKTMERTQKTNQPKQNPKQKHKGKHHVGVNQLLPPDVLKERFSKYFQTPCCRWVKGQIYHGSILSSNSPFFRS